MKNLVAILKAIKNLAAIQSAISATWKVTIAKIPNRASKRSSRPSRILAYIMIMIVGNHETTHSYFLSIYQAI